jgi:hypothetical protein
MSDAPPSDPAPHGAHVVVHPAVNAEVVVPFRRVDILGTQVGKAYQLADVIEFMRRAGLGDLHCEDPDLVEWRGGGPDVWE